VSQSATQLDLWLQGFPRDEAEARLADIEAEAATIRNALALADSQRRATQNGSGPEGAEDAPPNRPAAIRRMLRKHGNLPMAAGELKSEMLESGWLKESQEKLFYSAMSTMKKRKILLHLQTGEYMLSQKGLEMDE
jgi:ribosomal protein S21